jgi:glutathione S-transferase
MINCEAEMPPLVVKSRCAMLELYHDSDSIMSFKVRFCLAEKGLPWQEHRIILGKFDNLKPNYLKINAGGVVPSLIHDGNIVTESTVINEYIDEVFPDPPLVPHSPIERARMRIWTKYQDDVIHHSVRPATFQLMIKQRFKGLSAEEMDAKVASHPMPERRQAYREWTTGAVDVAAVQAAIRQMRDITAKLEQCLSQTLWLAGDSFSLADVAVATFVDRVDHLLFDFLWEDLPGVQDWIRRIKDRDAYQLAKPKQRLPIPDQSDVDLCKLLTRED